MNVLGRLALLFIVVPIVELAVLIRVGEWIGVWPTVGLVFLTGVTGAMLARAQGLRTLWKFQNELSSGALPGQAILDGVSILVGGALLLTPGFVTDLVGFSLLVPLTRRWVHRRMRKRLERMIEDGAVQVVGMPGNFGQGGFGQSGFGSDRSESAGFGHQGRSAESGDAGADELDPEKEISQ